MKRFFLLLLCCLPLAASEEFDLFMGKNTEHYRNLNQPKDLAKLAEFKELYTQNENLLTQATGESRIPRVIHFIWLGPRPFPAESVDNIRMWIGHHPEWTVKFWTDRDRHLPCSGMKKESTRRLNFHLLKKEYADSTNWGEKSDILRYEILFSEGGIYVDHDANCLRSFDHLADSFDLFCCLEAPHPPLAGEQLTCGNGVIGAAPGHPVIAKTMENIAERWERVGKRFCGEDGFNRTERVLHRTYTALTESVKELAGKTERRDVVLPAAYFFAKGKIRPLYSAHFYANAWADADAPSAFAEPMSKLKKLERKMAKLQQVLLGLIALQVGAVGLGIYLRRKRV